MRSEEGYSAGGFTNASANPESFIGCSHSIGGKRKTGGQFEGFL